MVISVQNNAGILDKKLMSLGSWLNHFWRVPRVGLVTVVVAACGFLCPSVSAQVSAEGWTPFYGRPAPSLTQYLSSPFEGQGFMSPGYPLSNHEAQIFYGNAERIMPIPEPYFPMWYRSYAPYFTDTPSWPGNGTYHPDQNLDRMLRESRSEVSSYSDYRFWDTVSGGSSTAPSSYGVSNPYYSRTLSGYKVIERKIQADAEKAAPKTAATVQHLILGGNGVRSGGGHAAGNSSKVTDLENGGTSSGPNTAPQVSQKPTGSEVAFDGHQVQNPLAKPREEVSARQTERPLSETYLALVAPSGTFKRTSETLNQESKSGLADAPVKPELGSKNPSQDSLQDLDLLDDPTFEPGLGNTLPKVNPENDPPVQQNPESAGLPYLTLAPYYPDGFPVKAEVKTDSKPEVKTDSKPEVKTDSKPEVKTDAKAAPENIAKVIDTGASKPAAESTKKKSGNAAGTATADSLANSDQHGENWKIEASGGCIDDDCLKPVFNKSLLSALTEKIKDLYNPAAGARRVLTTLYQDCNADKILVPASYKMEGVTEPGPDDLTGNFPPGKYVDYAQAIRPGNNIYLRCEAPDEAKGSIAPKTSKLGKKCPDACETPPTFHVSGRADMEYVSGSGAANPKDKDTLKIGLFNLRREQRGWGENQFPTMGCSGFVSAAFAASGAKILKSGVPSVAYQASTTELMDTGTDGRRKNSECLRPVILGPNETIKQGDVVVFRLKGTVYGHTFLIDSVGDDPLGINRIGKPEDCREGKSSEVGAGKSSGPLDGIYPENFNFNIIQSAGGKDRLAAMRIKAEETMGTPPTGIVIQKLAELACRARHGKRVEATLWSPFTEIKKQADGSTKERDTKLYVRVLRHVGDADPACREKKETKTIVAGEECRKNCEGPEQDIEQGQDEEQRNKTKQGSQKKPQEKPERNQENNPKKNQQKNRERKQQRGPQNSSQDELNSGDSPAAPINPARQGGN